MTRLPKPQSTFTRAEDSPRPGGLANGLGNLRPIDALITCGTAFISNAPPKK